MNNAEAILLATKQVKTIKPRWPAVCDEGKAQQGGSEFPLASPIFDSVCLPASTGSRNKPDRLAASYARRRYQIRYLQNHRNRLWWKNRNPESIFDFVRGIAALSGQNRIRTRGLNWKAGKATRLMERAI
jgi:hypothetical protein